MVERQALERELGKESGEKLYSRKVGGVDIGIATNIDRCPMVIFMKRLQDSPESSHSYNKLCITTTSWEVHSDVCAGG